MTVPYLIPLLVYISCVFKVGDSQYNPKWPDPMLRREIFLLNLEDGYFGCQVNESADFLQLFELSQLCDGSPQCFLGSDELSMQLKCTDRNQCHPKMPNCVNGVCLDGLCYCNDGFGGKGCDLPDENECKYRPCDVFAHCTNTMGSFYCSCFPGYDGDGFSCHDINECQEPALAALCADNAECCNLPGHFVCKCKPGFTGNATDTCYDVDECLSPNTCGANAICSNIPGSYSCSCQDGAFGDPYQGCQFPCDSVKCGAHSYCQVHDGNQPACMCDPGYTFDPSNITAGCVEINECDGAHGPSGLCGQGAICTNVDGSHHCNCPPGFTGDPFRYCEDIDECSRRNGLYGLCGHGALCENTPGSFACSCRPGFTGNPLESCNDIDECSQVFGPNGRCGLSAICTNSAGSYSCRCPPGSIGDPFVECIAENTCFNDDQCAGAAICQNGKCHCPSPNIRGECIHNLTCSDDSMCSPDNTCTFVNNELGYQCVNPCDSNPCGPNAFCFCENHRPYCQCHENYTGNPNECTPINSPMPLSECTTNDNCPAGKDCINGHCEPSLERACSRDNECLVGQICENTQCTSGCRYDDNCPENDACINGYCQNLCLLANACGQNAKCTPLQHRPQCECQENHIGDPFVRCDPIPENYCEADIACPTGRICSNNRCVDGCRNEQQCKFDETCVNQVCQNPCSAYDACGINAVCKTINHEKQCTCLPNFTGEPNVICEKIRPPPECTIDNNCPRGQICDDEKCFPGCRNSDNCPSDESCLNNICINPCAVSGACGPGAQCTPANHGAQCSCPSGFRGDPEVECREVQPECRGDDECGLEKYCLEEKCIPGCRTNKNCPFDRACMNGHCFRPLNDCFKDSECLLSQICENTQCTSGCRHDNNCPENDACINSVCQNPCLLTNACGRNAKCTPFQHRPRCECQENHIGDPFVRCDPIPDDYCEADIACPIGKICENNRCVDGCRNDLHCKFDEACINQVCQNPCSIYGACGLNAACKAVNHDRQCSCLPEFSGDAKVICEKIRPPPECTIDNNCPLGQICSDEKCVVGCRSSQNCPNEQSCVKNMCINACAVSGVCGQGATCTPANHIAVCTCPSGFRGDPEVECREIPPECLADNECGLEKICLRQKCVPGCRTHSNCPFDRACVNGFCQSPCDIGGMCGYNTICRTERHEAHCSCAPGYTGDPLKQCTKVFVECELDSDCGGGYVCAQNQCKDINECLKETLPCGPGASCQNLPGWYKCSCPLPLVGNAYGPEGCRSPIPVCFHDADCTNNQKCDPKTQECYDHCLTPGSCQRETLGCLSDRDCSTQKKCDPNSGQCYDPCTTKDPVLKCNCGQNAFCRTENHEATCQCPPGYEGYPDKVCLPIRECGVTFNCPGNLICLDSHTCGCPPTFFRENDYCFIRPQNCTTSNPCSANEECIYTGDSSGLCVCPHGFQLLPYGECRAIPLCGENNPCAAGALCRDKPGSYECVCPIDTIGDPYVKGCQPITGCTTDHDCPSDRECATSKQCISPCHICGPNAECTVRDHEAICVCAHGKVGEPYNKQVGCFTPPPPDAPPEVRTIPPVQDLQVMCLAEGVQVSVHLGGYDGIVYVKGHSNDANCRRLVTSNEIGSIDFKVLFGQCGLIHVEGEASFILVVQKHPRLVTYRARAYHIKCVYSTGERTVTLGFNVSMITTSGTIANTGPPPTCLMSICTLDGREISSAEIGDDLLLKVDVQPDFIYGGFARSCVATTVEDEGEFQYEVTDANGCSTDPSIFGKWEYDPHQKALTARFNAFKFPSSNNLRFQCNIRVCFGSCPPVNCDGVDSYGRRRRRQVREEDLVLTDAFKEGALREEIMVQSNAILTFEKRDPQPSAPIEGPRIEDIDHICLPKLGLILSMIITTLLALVAVAVAISCWLMAYRRRPQRRGPLPHPPEFPNPLYTTPESMAEPSPDYYGHTNSRPQSINSRQSTSHRLHHQGMLMSMK